MFDEQTKGSAVDRQMLDVRDLQATSSPQAVQCGQREIAQMLVVNGVELETVEQLFDVRHLDDRESSRRQHACDPIDEYRQVRDVCQDVVRVEHVCLSSPRHQ